MIFHITAASDWEAARVTGEYRLSTRGRTLDQEGFIHCSSAEQVVHVANAFYAGVVGLVLLAIDRQRLTAPVRDEAVGQGEERFAHIYGPLNTDAVCDVLALEPAADGTFSLPAGAAKYR